MKIRFLKRGSIADSYLSDVEDYVNFVKMLSFQIFGFITSKKQILEQFSHYMAFTVSAMLFTTTRDGITWKTFLVKILNYKNTGQIIFGGYGPTAQHSYFQLLHQGTQNPCVDIILNIENKKSLAFAQAITQAELLAVGATIQLTDEER